MCEIVDWRYSYRDDGNFLIICIKNCDTGYHSYIHCRIESEEQASQLLDFWERQFNMFFDVEYQHPN